MASGECPFYADPCDYIEDPNDIDNGFFECGDPNLTIYNFTPPIFWERAPFPNSLPDCYASLIFRSEDPNTPSFVPQPEKQQTIEWSISEPYEGNSFVLLSTGDLDPNHPDSEVKSSLLSQEVHLFEADMIMGAYFFGTCDYPNYDDHGEIYLESSEDPNTKIFIIDPENPNDLCATQWVGAYGSTENWMTFEYIIEPNMVGSYRFCCKVEDGGTDQIYKSYLAVDNLRICRGGLSIADLDWDCDVDLLDYSILSSAWLADCNEISDPNSPYYDPNIPCETADIDNNEFVDPNDLFIMFDQWLINPSAE